MSETPETDEFFAKLPTQNEYGDSYLIPEEVRGFCQKLERKLTASRMQNFDHETAIAAVLAEAKQ